MRTFAPLQRARALKARCSAGPLAARRCELVGGTADTYVRAAAEMRWVQHRALKRTPRLELLGGVESARELRRVVLVLQVDHRWLGVVGLAVADDGAPATAARRPAAPRGRRQLSRWLLTAYGALSLGSCLQLHTWAAVLFAKAPARQHGWLVVRCGHADELGGWLARGNVCARA